MESEIKIGQDPVSEKTPVLLRVVLEAGFYQVCLSQDSTATVRRSYTQQTSPFQATRHLFLCSLHTAAFDVALS